MKRLSGYFLLVIICCSCKKDDVAVPLPQPAMQYINLQDQEAVQGRALHIDLDGDGARDFSFGALLIGDPIMQTDKLQFFISSTENRFVMEDANYNAPVFTIGQSIAANAKPGCSWYDIAYVMLAQKTTTMQGAVYWQGNWCNQYNQYLPFYLYKKGQRFYGWFRLSMDTAAEKIILHRAAICKEAYTPVSAGY
jgi:hypothetical protein